MQEIIHPVTREKVKFPDLAKIIAEAPSEVDFSEHGFGFDLTNEMIRVSYSVYHGALALVFRKTEPQIIVINRKPYMREIPKSLSCDVLSVGDFSVYLNPRERGEVKGEKEWFSYGTEILKAASEKFAIPQYYSTFCLRQAMTVLPIPEEMKKRARIVFD